MTKGWSRDDGGGQARDDGGVKPGMTKGWSRAGEGLMQRSAFFAAGALDAAKVLNARKGKPGGR